MKPNEGTKGHQAEGLVDIFEDDGTGPVEDWNRFGRHERERVLFATRLPSELFFKLKKQAIRSTLQLLTEHAITMYLGGRLPPDLWGGHEWPEEFPTEPRPAYLATAPRQFSARIPRSLLRWFRTWAVQAEISEQDLAVKIFDWYVRKGLTPPKKEEARRNSQGLLQVDQPLLALKFRGYTVGQVAEALGIMIERHATYGNSRGNPETRRLLDFFKSDTPEVAVRTQRRSALSKRSRVRLARTARA